MIFKSYDSAKLSHPLADESENYWSYIELTINSLWFVVKISSLDDENPNNSTLFLSSTIQLADLSARTDIEIAEVHVVSPPHKNKEKTWKMSQVSKVLKGIKKGKEFDAHVFKYVFTDGNELVDTNFFNKVPKSTVFETIYSS